jgi:hypothetical protein
MKMPLCFPGSESPQLLAKGVPVSRRSSRFYSELVLFTMDVAVLGSSGVFLYRNHDDILFFGRDDKPALKAWETIHTLASRFGLRLNSDKSGSVRLCCAPVDVTEAETSSFGPEPLLQKSIRWGLMELQRDATVRIMDDQVDWFAWELAQKLNKTTSVLRWITVYNKYMRFFLRNFGSVSPVFGLAHADNMIQQVQHIHGIVFPGEMNGDVREALRQKILVNHPELLGANPVDPLPAAWVYWPLDLGGLGLFHPLLELWSYRRTLENDEGSTTTTTTSREPLHGLREKVQRLYTNFVETADREGLSAAVARTFSRTSEQMFAVLESSTFSETHFPPRTSGNGSNFAIDKSFAICPLEDFAARLDRYDNLVSDAYAALLPATDVRAHPSYDDAEAVARRVFGSVELPNREY